MNNYQLQLDSDNPNVRFKKNSENEYVLSILDEAEADEPIELYLKDLQKLVNINLFINIGKNSKSTILLWLKSKSDQIINLKTTITTKRGGNIKVIILQNLTENSNLMESYTVKASDFSFVDLISLQLGGKEVKSDMRQEAGKSSDVNTYLLCRAKKLQNYNFNLISSYESENGRGKIMAKCILSDESNITLNGVIKIGKNGIGTNARLKQDCLLLDKKVKVISTPALKINTDNVQAIHSASTSNINDEDLFYFAARGISPDSARKILITGFVAEVMNKLENLEKMKDYILTNF